MKIHNALFVGLTNLWTRIIKLGFRLLYYELSWSYDFVSWIVSFGQWREWQKVALNYLIGTQILELAHGPGHMLIEMHRRGYHPIGIDRSPNMSRQALKRIIREKAKASVIQAYAQSLPFADRSFDTLVSTFPTDFILQDTTLKEVNRILRPGGRLIIISQARSVGGSFAKKIVEWLYVITNQRPIPEEDLAKSALWKQSKTRFLKAGFEITYEIVTLEGSVVTVLVASSLPSGL